MALTQTCNAFRQLNKQMKYLNRLIVIDDGSDVKIIKLAHKTEQRNGIAVIS